MATTDTMKTEDDEFSSAFNEKPTTKVEQTEDEAFGITPEAKEPAVVETADAAPIDATPDVTESEGAAAGGGDPVASAEAMGAEPAAEDEDKPMTAGQLKSWQGRLKAENQRLKALAASKAPATESAPAETPAEGGAVAAAAIQEAVDTVDEDPAKEAKAEAVAEKVESGEMTAEQAMAQLAEDFGPDFVKMIEVIAASKAKEAGSAAAKETVTELGKTVDEIIADIVDGKAKAHFKAIVGKHPDFADIAVDPGFQGYVDAMEEDGKADAVRVIQGGSADEINALLDGYKATLSPAEAKEVTAVQKELAADPALEDSIDDAEGVRSSGMRLPEQPGASADDYEAAWNKA